MEDKIVCDDQVVAFGVLETLSQSCPTDLCEGLIAEDSKEASQLEWALAEQFILKLVKLLPQVSTMIKVWLIYQKFEKEFNRVCSL